MLLIKKQESKAAKGRFFTGILWLFVFLYNLVYSKKIKG